MKYQNKRRLRKHEHRSPFEITLDKTDEDEDEDEKSTRETTVILFQFTEPIPFKSFYTFSHFKRRLT